MTNTSTNLMRSMQFIPREKGELFGRHDLSHSFGVFTDPLKTIHRSLLKSL
jgi:hypothetical protein